MILKEPTYTILKKNTMFSLMSLASVLAGMQIAKKWTQKSDSLSDSDSSEDETVSSSDPDDEIMKDFYEESEQTEEWMSLTDKEKLDKLDADLDEYMKEGRKKMLDQIRD